MSITTGETIEEKREKIRKLREFHQKTFDDLGIPNAIFIPKMAYRPIGKSEIHIGFFANEINKGEDVFVEFCSKENIPEDPDRKLYKWKYNPHFHEEYDKTEPNAISGHVRYLVPIEELILIKDNKVVEQTFQPEFNLPDAETDLPLDQMTMRDFAAIILREPISRKEWLNKLIEQSRPF